MFFELLYIQIHDIIYISWYTDPLAFYVPSLRKFITEP